MRREAIAIVERARFDYAKLAAVSAALTASWAIAFGFGRILLTLAG